MNDVPSGGSEQRDPWSNSLDEILSGEKFIEVSKSIRDVFTEYDWDIIPPYGEIGGDSRTLPTDHAIEVLEFRSNLERIFEGDNGVNINNALTYMTPKALADFNGLDEDQVNVLKGWLIYDVVRMYEKLRKIEIDAQEEAEEIDVLSPMESLEGLIQVRQSVLERFNTRNGDKILQGFFEKR